MGPSYDFDSTNSEANHEISFAITPVDPDEPISAPIVSSYNQRIRPLLDAVDKLRELMIMEEGIQLPTIVVVGDQSSGKSSVLESLAGISLPRGQGICTRVPLVMKLQQHSDPQPELSLAFNGEEILTDEDHISEDINKVTERIAGPGKGISNSPITLVVKKLGVPDLTMVDLPGITRVPVRGQPDNIYEQIRDIIMEYIKPEESIILNVLSATVDFTTCESIRMSQSVDKTGERTLAVVTKADKAPEGLLEKVTADDVNIGLGYVCVRNRIGNESYEEARVEEAILFQTHPLLSKIDKSIVGIPVLAQKLAQIQATSIARNLPEITNKINDKLNTSVAELNKLPKHLNSVAEATATFMQIVEAVKESLRKILLRGEFEEYPDDKHMHCTARLTEMLNKFSDELHACAESDPIGDFLMDEIKILEESKKISLPNFLPRTAFLGLLNRKVKGISGKPIEFVGDLWDYIEEVVMKVLMQHVEGYYQLQLSTRQAGQNLIAKMKERSIKWMQEIVEMEMATDYTCNPEYTSEWNKLMAQSNTFMYALFEDKERLSTVKIEGLGKVEHVEGLRQHRHLIPQAFDLRMRLIAYWKIVLRRFVDCMALHLQLSVKNLVKKELGMEIMNESLAFRVGGIEKLMEELPSVASKRVRLNRSIKKLRDCKAVVANIMDRIVSYGD
ncbi:dynamin-related protein 4C-like [Ziziphus jujuba]|uniref:Dynamin-related protein 4C n=1 Tax=Ziziphus jujuba TaxID=326968 RepID=A0ABM3I7J8_ZIZJJ|nr:dynamin-related protein 4C-like [Ziziphus jujuba var. spinosa]XP_048322235.1 dynamin-related protein 4C [Ziziphus jujuba]XP_060672180.1 dynamin-related protein 4C-like [Ziziphus jujuba]